MTYGWYYRVMLPYVISKAFITTSLKAWHGLTVWKKMDTSVLGSQGVALTGLLQTIGFKGWKNKEILTSASNLLHPLPFNVCVQYMIYHSQHVSRKKRAWTFSLFKLTERSMTLEFGATTCLPYRFAHFSLTGCPFLAVKTVVWAHKAEIAGISFFYAGFPAQWL